jgi:uncharacterized protein
MSPLELVQLNLLSPIVLAFVLGIVATLVRSDLKFPEELYTALTIYLLLAIGLKGGAALSVTPISEFWAPALAALALGCVIPIWTYGLLRKIGKMSVADAAAIAAHYGSVSAVTFIASLAFLDAAGVAYEGFMPTLLAILEVPAIVVALLIAQMRMREGPRRSWQAGLRKVVSSKSVLLLIGGLGIGVLGGERGLMQVAPFFVEPFHGALALFLLELGMTTARRLRDLRQVGAFLIGFGIIMPILHGILGVFVGSLVGLSVGGSTVLGVLSASASYIAAPAAVRISLPTANPGYYLTASLAITFPFNLAIGIPLYFAIANWLFS